MTERDGDPARLVRAMAVVRKEPPLSRNALEFLGTRNDVVEVGREDEVAVSFWELENEAATLVEGVLDGVDVVGPREVVSEEGVVDGVIGGYGEGDSVGGLGAREGESATRAGRRVNGVEVEVDVAVEIVEVDAAVAVELWDLYVREWAEQVLEGLVEGVEEREEL